MYHYKLTFDILLCISLKIVTVYARREAGDRDLRFMRIFDKLF